MVSISWPILLVQIANFLLLIFALNIVLYKPIRKILRDRSAKFKGLETSADETGRLAQEKNQAFAEGLRAARLKGQQEKEALMQAAKEEENSLVAKINAKAQEELAAVKAKIAKDTDSVRNALEKEVDSFADAITQKILGRAA